MCQKSRHPASIFEKLAHNVLIFTIWVELRILATHGTPGTFCLTILQPDCLLKFFFTKHFFLNCSSILKMIAGWSIFE